MDKSKRERISLVGLPFDEKSSFLKGCAKAPPLIRESLYSYAINSFAENGVDIRDENISDRGDFSVNELSEIIKIADKFLGKGERILAMGGDHSITYPLVKAYSGYCSDIEILHIDAHPDLYEELDGDRLSHACPFARIMEENLAARLVQIGVRTMNPHQREQSEKFGVETIEMKDLHITKIPVFNNPVYISIDLDGIDPAFAPGVSHHEPGGLSSRQVIDIIGKINVPVIGGDVVEFNPQRDISGITSALAAKLIKEILSIMVKNG